MAIEGARDDPVGVSEEADHADSVVGWMAAPDDEWHCQAARRRRRQRPAGAHPPPLAALQHPSSARPARPVYVKVLTKKLEATEEEVARTAKESSASNGAELRTGNRFLAAWKIRASEIRSLLSSPSLRSR